jgi:hypothetical protein
MLVSHALLPKAPTALTKHAATQTDRAAAARREYNLWLFDHVMDSAVLIGLSHSV